MSNTNFQQKEHRLSVKKKSITKKKGIILFIIFVVLFLSLYYFMNAKIKTETQNADNNYNEEGLASVDSVSPGKDVSISFSSLDEACLEKVDKISDIEMIELAKDVDKMQVINPSSNIVKGGDVALNMFAYYRCKIRESGNEEGAYVDAIDFFNNLKYPYHLKDHSIDSFHRIKNEGSEYDDIRLAVAYGDFDDLCPSKLKQICIDNSRNPSSERVKICDELCAYIDNALIDEDFYEKGIIKLVDFYDIKNTDPVTMSSRPITTVNAIPWWKIALAYRKGGDKDALRICGGMAETAIVKCVERVNFVLDFIKNKNYNCDTFYLDKLRDYVCRSEIK